MTGEAETPARSLAARSTALLVGALALMLIAGGAAIWLGISWFTAGDNDSLNYSQARDEVQRSGVAAIKKFTTLDYRDPDAYFQGISETTTGELRDELAKSTERYKQGLVTSRSRTIGKVLDSAVTNLDLRQGTAEMIAAVDADVVRDSGAPATQRLWLQVNLERADSDWKVSNLLGAPGITTAGQ
jgi:Mce-associated membrane protein